MNPALSSAPAHTNRRRTLFLVGSASLTALALVVFMVASVTRAAWTDTTDNAGNSWATGTVELTDDDSDSAMFTASDMLPGDEVTHSITVTNAGSVPLDVKLYGANLADADSLAQHLNLKIGTTAGGHDVYDAGDGTTGTLNGFASAHTDYASGTAAITLAAGGTQTYHFTVTLDADTSDTFQGATAGIDFVWEGHTQ